MYNLTFSYILILGALVVFLFRMFDIFNTAWNFPLSLEFLLINAKINYVYRDN